MLLIYVFILVCAFVGMHKCTEQESATYTGKRQAAAIKGIFVLLVFASHAGQYLFDLVTQVPINTAYLHVKMLLGQMIVVPFLFYSGYGVRFSVEKKGIAYMRAFPKNRILKTYLHVALILLAFWLMQLAFGERYSTGFVVRSFLLWDTFGNSNWYMFAIFALYIFTAASYLLLRNTRTSIWSIIVLTIIYMAVMSRFKEPYWFSTVLLYPFGMLFYDWESRFRDVMKSGGAIWLGTLAGCFALVFALTVIPLENQLLGAFLYNFKGIILMILILALTVRVRIQNALLIWLGNYVFELYLLQRLPMIALTNCGLAASNPILWLLCSAVITVLLAVGCKKARSAFDGFLFRA